MKAKAKKLLASVSPAALTLMSGADAVAQPPLPTTAFSWSGCYVGAHAGYGWGKLDASRVSDQTFFTGPAHATTSTSHSTSPSGVDTSGGVFGGQVGCNYQFASHWLVGIEASVSGADIKGSVADPFVPGASISAKTDFLASVAGRVGRTAFDGQGLFYLKGGVAHAHNKWSSPVINTSGDLKEELTGYIAGGGFEWKFTPQWSAFIDYSHYGFSSQGTTATGINSVPGPFGFGATNRDQLTTGQANLDVVKAGVNYKFTSP